MSALRNLANHVAAKKRQTRKQRFKDAANRDYEKVVLVREKFKKLNGVSIAHQIMAGEGRGVP